MKNSCKKHIFFLFLFFLSFCALSSQNIEWGSNYKPGNFIAGFSGAYEASRAYYYSGSAIGLYPAAEVILWKPVIGDVAPIDFGLGATGRMGIPLNQYADFSMGLAFVGSMHIGFLGLDVPGSEYLDNLDIYAHFGISVDLISPQGLQIGTVATSGFNYFFDENLNLGVSYTGWGNWDHGVDGVAIHIRYRFGKSPLADA